MFERFTGQARRSVLEARAIALAADAPGVGEEHLLAALFAQPRSAAVRLLERAGCGPEIHGGVAHEVLGARGITSLQLRALIQPGDEE